MQDYSKGEGPPIIYGTSALGNVVADKENLFVDP